MLKRLLKNERGLTLIELLAVVVILGIISAIAIPSIGGLIDNSKKDAHVANARQMINAAKIAVTAKSSLLPTTTTPSTITLNTLVTDGYIEAMTDPDTSTKTGYDAVNSKVVISTTDGKTFNYAVYLKNATRAIQEGTTAGTPVDENAISRDKVVK